MVVAVIVVVVVVVLLVVVVKVVAELYFNSDFRLVYKVLVNLQPPECNYQLALSQ